jgi:type I restriction enzyme S subunit
MSEWTTVALADIADIRFSNVDKKSLSGEVPVRLCNYMDVYLNNYITADLPFMEATATALEMERFKVEQGDNLITKDSETPEDIGIPAVVVDEIRNLVCGYHLALIKPKRDKVDPVYLSKQLGSRQSAVYFSRLANGSTRYGLSSAAIDSVKIPLAPLVEQRQIATVLSTLDKAIEKTESLIAKYQQIKAGLMHDLFTRGVTPDGKLRPPREQAPELYQETLIGWIPKEWATERIGHLFNIQLGKMLSKASKTGRWTAAYLGNKNVQWDKIDLNSLEEMDFLPAEREKFSLVPGDLLVCEGGDVGRTAIWNGEMAGCYYQKAIHRLRPKDGRISPRYALRYMRYAKGQGLLSDFTSQTSIAHLTQEQLSKVRITVPPRKEQAAIYSLFPESVFLVS